MLFNFIATAQKVINAEISEIQNLTIGDDFVKACELILSNQGRVIVIGMGKSGHIGNKIAATLASTGTPAFFVHPGEASHGDLGMITEQDVVIIISNSGEADEILLIMPVLKRLDIPVIAMTGNGKSTLAQNADVHLNIGARVEACPLNLAPTCSTTNTLVIGDTLAVTLLQARGFTKEDFARSHPAGSLGKRLLTKVGDIMHTGDELPVVLSQTLFSQALIIMSNKRLGMVAVTNQRQQIIGVFTDGDLRRALTAELDLEHNIIDDFMTVNCVTVGANILAESALQIMETNNINGLLVISDQKLVGALNMLDLVRAKII